MTESSSSQSSTECDSQPTSLVRESSQSSSDSTVSPNRSSPSSTENYIPSRTCDWTRSLVHKLGIRYEYEQLSNIVIELMSSLAHFF